MLVSDNPGGQNYIHPGGRKIFFFVNLLRNNSDFIWKQEKNIYKKWLICDPNSLCFSGTSHWTINGPHKHNRQCIQSYAVFELPSDEASKFQKTFWKIINMKTHRQKPLSCPNHWNKTGHSGGLFLNFFFTKPRFLFNFAIII